ncbi:MAG: hypothetical protein AMXMBFR64_56490 [Myxococcales bacterium]
MVALLRLAVLLAFLGACASDSPTSTADSATLGDTGVADTAVHMDVTSSDTDVGAPPVDVPTPAPDVPEPADACDGCSPAPVCPHGCDHGTCVDGACACDPGFAGDRCQVCDSGHFGPTCAPCTCAAGTCMDGLEGSGTCVCPAGFSGPSCETEADAIPFDAVGPYGTGIKDRVADLGFPTPEGTFTLSERWTGHHSYLFVLRYSVSAYNKQVWASDLKALLKRAPSSTVLIFGSLDSTWQKDMDELRVRLDAALAALSPEARASWAGRIHTIDVRAGELPFVAAQGAFWFAIDRFQRWREIGSLYDFVTGASPIEFMGHEPLWFDYEARIAHEMAALDATVVPVWVGEQHQGGWGGGYASRKTVELPSAAEMAKFDSLAVHVVTSCPEHKQGKEKGCNEWDYIQDLRICDVEVAPDPGGACTEGDTLPCACARPDGTTVDKERACVDGAFAPCPCGCDTELVRWVTSYGREGEWVTDVSPLLALLKDGGPVTFQFGGANAYLLDLRLLLWDAGKGVRPVKALHLWGNGGGEGFGKGYNDNHPDVTFQTPPGTVRAEVYAVISGHGFGGVKENCAEFCNHQHKFTLNGKSWVKTHPTAGTPYGCRDQISDGVVPNQFGSWVFGRGGWCPGMDVLPWTADVTEKLAASNTLSYLGQYAGKDYDPVITDPGAYLPEIKMASWLIFYEAAP